MYCRQCIYTFRSAKQELFPYKAKYCPYFSYFDDDLLLGAPLLGTVC